VGGDNEWQNLELVHHICNLLNEEVGEGPDGDYKNLITFVSDRPGHDYRYAIDASKIKNELGWKQGGSFKEDLRNTVQWYIERYEED
jgi:dTDP-glucose 4,6-dehydratase